MCEEKLKIEGSKAGHKSNFSPIKKNSCNIILPDSCFVLRVSNNPAKSRKPSRIKIFYYAKNVNLKSKNTFPNLKIIINGVEFAQSNLVRYA